MNDPYSWQVPQLEQLRHHLLKQDLAHAYLIDDPAGEGSQGFVRALASTILCEQTQLGGCSSCSSCQLQSAGSHSDLLWVMPEDSKQIKIEQIRSVIEWSHQTPQQGRAKVLVLDPADRMNVYATNSLLKLLEEPAPNTYLFLISTSLHGINLHLVLKHVHAKSTATTLYFVEEKFHKFLYILWLVLLKKDLLLQISL